MQIRRYGDIHHDTGIVLNMYHELWIYTTGGRPIIPYLVIDQKRMKLKYQVAGIKKTDLNEMIKHGCIEYISAIENEQKYTFIAVTEGDVDRQREYVVGNLNNFKNKQEQYKNGEITLEELEKAEQSYNIARNEQRYSHCMIDPSQYIGISVFTMRYMSHNPPARVSYQAGMTKQALTTKDALRFDIRFDTGNKSIITTGVPISGTIGDKLIGLDEYGIGRNAIVGILPYGGKNQEDCIIMNKMSVDLGLFQYMVYHSYTVSIKTRKGMNEIIRIPDHQPQNAYKYRNLDPATGIIMEGAEVKLGDCLVGKMLETTVVTMEGGRQVHTKSLTDTSLYVKIGKEGIVDEVMESHSIQKSKLISIRLKEIKNVEEGDKFSSGYAQKGTTGLIIAPEDMPFVSDEYGELQLDILFNPHGMPSRMTVGKLIELHTGSLGLATGKRRNASAHMPYNYAEIAQELRELGYKENGLRTVYNGKTGLKMEAEIFVGPVFYQALPHLVKYKKQARGFGRKQNLTHQPIPGIRNDGGLRLGEMEKDLLVAYGCSYLLIERLCISSDAYNVVTCSCGQITHFDVHEMNYKCLICNRKGKTKDVTNMLDRSRVSYPIKLFIQTLAGAHVKIGMVAQNKCGIQN